MDMEIISRALTDTFDNEGRKDLNKDLLVPYVAPYLAYVALASLPDGLLAVEWNYALRLLVVPSLLVYFWRAYLPLLGCERPFLSIGVGLVAGLVGTALWVGLVVLFRSDELRGVPWSDAAFVLRLLAAGLVVPIFEELLMRGYVLRLAWQWDEARKAGYEAPFERAFHEQSINQVPAGSWSLLAVTIATLVFALGHEAPEWPAALAYGMLMALLWIVRKDLISCIVAHSITNVALALYVQTTGQWSLW